MIYKVRVLLPHKSFTGKLNFEEKPNLGDIVLLLPGAYFKVIEPLSGREVTLRFEVIYHDSNAEYQLSTLGLQKGAI